MSRDALREASDQIKEIEDALEATPRSFVERVLASGADLILAIAFFALSFTASVVSSYATSNIEASNVKASNILAFISTCVGLFFLKVWGNEKKADSARAALREALLVARIVEFAALEVARQQTAARLQRAKRQFLWSQQRGPALRTRRAGRQAGRPGSRQP